MIVNQGKMVFCLNIYEMKPNKHGKFEWHMLIRILMLYEKYNKKKIWSSFELIWYNFAKNRWKFFIYSTQYIKGKTRFYFSKNSIYGMFTYLHMHTFAVESYHIKTAWWTVLRVYVIKKKVWDMRKCKFIIISIAHILQF